MIALMVIAAVLVVGAVAGLGLGLASVSVSRDIRQREREGTDPESLNWRERYTRGYPRD